MNKSFSLIVTLVFIMLTRISYAQLDMNFQLVQRAEYRHGYGKLIEKGKDPSIYVNQRLRLQGLYKFDKVRVYAGIQDVRIWGNTPQLKTSDPFLSVHEAWGEIDLDTTWTLKAGRQELNYNNGRFLGSLDWGLQGRAHDFLLLKHESKSLILHAGGGYNHETESLSGNLFTVANQYKTAQMLYLEKKAGPLEAAFLVWNNGKQYSSYDSINDVQQKGIRFTQTISVPMIKFQTGLTEVSGFYYYQTGIDPKGKPVDAYDASLQVSQNIKCKKEGAQQLRVTAGGELISGSSSGSSVNRSYSPYFGTNHSHNGYMDMFYLGGRHENSVGLLDLFVRMKFDITPKLFVSTNYHYFKTHKAVQKGTENLNQELGQEVDLTFGCVVTKNLSIQGGYSQFFSTSTMSYLQGVKDPENMQNWAYLMVVVRPAHHKKFIGLLF